MIFVEIELSSQNIQNFPLLKLYLRLVTKLHKKSFSCVISDFFERKFVTFAAFTEFTVYYYKIYKNNISTEST